MEVGNKTMPASSIQDLPDSLLIEILLRLPSKKFVIQCQLVCTNWCSLISTPVFLQCLKDHRLISCPCYDCVGIEAFSNGFLRVWELEEYHSGKWSINGKEYETEGGIKQEVAGEEEKKEEVEEVEAELEEKEDKEVEEVAGEVEEEVAGELEEEEVEGHEHEHEELLEEHRRGQWSFKGEAYWKEIIYDDAILKKRLESDNCPYLYALSLDPYDEDIVQFATDKSSNCVRVYSCNLRTKEVKLVDGTIPDRDYVEDAFHIPLRQCPTMIPRIS
ncbi:hypothetical protein Tsubulata_038901 [Turnera subulata]|uniref:F-box domain-containing protein n=1 Tax=Turnera subulata TaxID=218843 RepID=A0A9Q0FSL6_9ROSI|nr:hypothetical protein Tsubulata_038901 [Turnera subulata]